MPLQFQCRLRGHRWEWKTLWDPYGVEENSLTLVRCRQCRVYLQSVAYLYDPLHLPFAAHEHWRYDGLKENQ